MKAVLVAVVLLPALALADSVNVSLTNKALKGKGLPTVHLEILEPIAGFRLTLARDGGKAQEWKGGGKPGVTRSIELPQAEGPARWAGELTVNLPNGTTANMPLEFQTELVGSLTLLIDKDKDVDIAGRKVRFTLNQPIAKVHLKVLMDTGALVVDDDIAFNGEPPGTKLEVTWPEASGQMLRLDLRAWAQSGCTKGGVSPWRIDIPRRSELCLGKWDVSTEESAKLESSLKLVFEAVAKFGCWPTSSSTLLATTDTVGAGPSIGYSRSIGPRASVPEFRKKECGSRSCTRALAKKPSCCPLR